MTEDLSLELVVKKKGKDEEIFVEEIDVNGLVLLVETSTENRASIIAGDISERELALMALSLLSTMTKTVASHLEDKNFKDVLDIVGHALMREEKEGLAVLGDSFEGIETIDALLEKLDEEGD